MRIISFCSDGIRDAADKGFFDWATKQDAEFICLQNLAAQEYDLQDDVFFPSGYNAYFFDAVEPNSNGVAIYTRNMPKAIMTGLGQPEFDMEGRYIQADFEKFSVGCLLAPFAYGTDSKALARKQQFLQHLHAYLAKVRNKRREFILVGNWQTAHRPEDLQDPKGNQNQSGFLVEEQQLMDQLFVEIGYTDALREVTKDNDEFTWWPNGKRGEDGWRVDYQVVSAGLKPAVEFAAIYKNQEFGQHAPLIVDYDYEP